MSRSQFLMACGAISTLFLATADESLARERLGPRARAAKPGEMGQDSLLRLARRLRDDGQIMPALETFQRIAKMAPQDHEIQLEVADIQLAARRYDDAAGIYQKLVEIPEQRSGARLGLMRIAYALDDFEGVLTQFEMLRAHGPVTDVRAWLCQAVTLDRLKRHGEAQASYRNALAIAPRSIAARNNLALSLALVRQYEEAVAILRPLAASSDALPRVRQNLALIYGLMGKADDAEQLGLHDLTEIEVAQNTEFFKSLQP